MKSGPEISVAVVPVAGLGTRLLPATKSQPKEMLPVAKKPVVQYVVEELGRNGIQEILFVTGRTKTSIENHFDPDQQLIRNLRESGKEDLLLELDYEQTEVQFFYTRQRLQRGLGDAVRCARQFTQNRPFVVALGDSIIGLDSPSHVVSAHDPDPSRVGGGLRGRRRDGFSSGHLPVWDRGTGRRRSRISHSGSDRETACRVHFQPSGLGRPVCLLTFHLSEAGPGPTGSRRRGSS